MSKAFELKKFVENEKRLIIQPHNYPDPDGIASAFALCELIKHFGVEAKIYFHGALQRSIMLTMISDMQIDLHCVDETVLKPDDKIILVDCSPNNSNVMDLGGTITGVIDHHEFHKELNYPFMDIRPTIGSTSTIIAGYYFDLGIKPSKDVATALAIGLNIDTSFLTRKVTRTDIDMYSNLIDFVDIDTMRFIIINNLELKDIKYFKRALDNFKNYKNFLFANVGEDSESNFTGIISDFFLSLKEIDFVVIYTLTHKGVILSIRNLSSDWNAAKIVQKTLQSIGTGGGHKHMAGGFIKFSEMPPKITEDELFERFKKVLFTEEI